MCFTISSYRQTEETHGISPFYLKPINRYIQDIRLFLNGLMNKLKFISYCSEDLKIEYTCDYVFTLNNVDEMLTLVIALSSGLQREEGKLFKIDNKVKRRGI